MSVNAIAVMSLLLYSIESSIDKIVVINQATEHQSPKSKQRNTL